MKQTELAKWKFSDGYSSARSVLDGGDFAQSGSENIMFNYNRRPTAFNGMTILSPTTGGRIMFNFSDTYAALLDNGSTAKGSIFMISAGKTLAVVGSGHAYLTGVTLSTAASTTPQLLTLRSGSYTSILPAYQFGLSTPDAPEVGIAAFASGPQVTDQGALTAKLKGTYSIRITKIRSTTGAESNASLTSAVVTFSSAGGSMRITFPSIGSNGADRFGIYGTLAGFGAIGPQYFYIEVRESDITATRAVVSTLAATTPMVTLTSGTLTSLDIGRQITHTGGSGPDYTGYITQVLSGTTADVAVAPTASTGGAGFITQAVDGILRSVAVEWLDADLVGGDLPPINNDPPNPGWFGFSLQDTAAIVGTGGDQVTGVTGAPGNVIEPSRPGFPEAFPADTHLFLPEAPTAVLERGADNYVFIFGANSLCAVTYRGGINPLDLQLVWSNTGILYPHNAVIADGRLYAVTGTGLVRMGANGQPEREWAIDIAPDLESLTLGTIFLGWDANSKHVCIMSGTKIWAFNTLTERFSTPLNLTTLVAPITGNIVGAVTLSGSLKISVLNGSTFSLYTFNSGTGSVWKIFSSWQDGGTPDLKTAMTMRGTFQHDAAGTVEMAIYGTNRQGEYELDSPVTSNTVNVRSWNQYVKNARVGIVIKPRKADVKASNAFATYMTATSAGGTVPSSAPVNIELEGTTDPIR